MKIQKRENTTILSTPPIPKPPLGIPPPPGAPTLIFGNNPNANIQDATKKLSNLPENGDVRKL